jgi:hypothetical protein
LKAAANKIKSRNGANSNALTSYKQEHYKKIKAKQAEKSGKEDDSDDIEESNGLSKNTLYACGGFVLVIFFVSFLASIYR